MSQRSTAVAAITDDRFRASQRFLLWVGGRINNLQSQVLSFLPLQSRPWIHVAVVYMEASWSPAQNIRNQWAVQITFVECSGTGRSEGGTTHAGDLGIVQSARPQRKANRLDSLETFKTAPGWLTLQQRLQLYSIPLSQPAHCLVPGNTSSVVHKQGHAATLRKRQAPSASRLCTRL